MALNFVSKTSNAADFVSVNVNGFVGVAQRAMRPTGLMSRGQYPTLLSLHLATAKPTWPSHDRRPGAMSPETIATRPEIECRGRIG